MTHSYYGLLFQSAIPGFLCGLLLLIFILGDKTFDRVTIKGFICAVGCAFLLGILDATDFIFDRLQIYPFLQIVLGSFSIIFKVGCVIYIVRISQRRNVYHRRLLTVLFSINAVISIINIWTGILFTINPDFTTELGRFSSFPYIVIAIAGVLFLLCGIKNLRTNLGEGLVIIAIIIAFLASNTLELYYNTYFLVSQVCEVCIVFYFLCLNVELYKRDALTELLNRRSFYADCEKFKKHRMLVLSMDLNNLKKYNDEYGHDAGDLAIKTSARCMEKAFNRIGIVYRTGGDEFMALFHDKSPAQLDKAIANFRTELDKTEYEVACGYAQYEPGNDIEDIIKLADDQMYINKKTLKGPSRS